MFSIPVVWLLNQRSLNLHPIHTPSSHFTVVHVTELTDPTEFTMPGSLILTVGLAFENSPEDFHGYVDRLARAGVHAIGFGTGLIFKKVPSRLFSRDTTRCARGLGSTPRPV